MAENRGQGQRPGTTTKNKRQHQEEVERPTGKGTFHSSKTPARYIEDLRWTPTSSPTTHSMEEQVFAILDTEGLATVGGGLDSGGGQEQGTTLQETVSEILGASQHSKDTMGQILDNAQENRWLQEGECQGIRVDLQAINNTLISTAGVLADLANIMREAVPHQRAPVTSQSSEQPSTSAAASGQEALSQDQQATSNPPPAEGEPPRKLSLRSRQKP
ncbi:hypothetical protein NDU88_005347 [Pleurodeles waltl]|uniref:Uncharacterized protein n=1 Tax=Pleurodeles waltl TaxID=8319 RepID=A0AAV7RL76_PLEWA|nr:hypothetical protein NDU88_005347 [Pleurodeles waltl]